MIPTKYTWEPKIRQCLTCWSTDGNCDCGPNEIAVVGYEHIGFDGDVDWDWWEVNGTKIAFPRADYLLELILGKHEYHAMMDSIEEQYMEDSAYQADMPVWQWKKEVSMRMSMNYEYYDPRVRNVIA